MYRKLFAVMIALMIGFTSTVDAHAVDPDTTPPIVTGVDEGVIYTSLVTVTFNEGTASLNDVSVTSPFVVAKNGDYTFVATDASNNVTTVHFTMADVTSPIVTGVLNNQPYIDPVTITFNEGTATLDGNPFESGTLVSDLGVHKLVVVDPAENQTVVNFAIVADAQTPYIYDVRTSPESKLVTLYWKTVGNFSSYRIFSYDFTADNWYLDAVTNTSLTNSGSKTLYNLAYSTNYRYTMAVYNPTTSVVGPTSNVVEFRTNDNPEIGKVVINLKAAISNYVDVDLTWEPAALAVSYKIYYRRGSISTVIPAGQTTGTSFRFDNLEFGTSYAFMVAAVLGDGTEYTAKEVSLTTTAPPQTVIQNISAAQTGTSGAIVTWQATGASSSYHVVLYSIGDAKKIEAFTNTTSYTFLNLDPTAIYEVRVSAVGTIDGANYELNFIRYYRHFYLINPPTNLHVVSTTYNSINIAWTLKSTWYTYIELCISTTSATSGFACLIPENIYSYTKSAVINNTYYVKIRTLNSIDGITNGSAFTPVVVMRAAMTTPVVSAYSSGYDRVTLSWDRVDGAWGYEIYQSTSSVGPFTLVATTTTASYVKTGLATNTAYYYKVRAYLLSGPSKFYSAYSIVIASRPVPAAPIVTAASAAYNSVKVSWPVVLGASGYEVSYTRTDGGVFTVLPTTLATSSTVSGLATNQLAYFKVRAYRLVGTTKIFGASSTIVSAKPIPSTPVLTVASNGYNSLRISWPAVSGADGYELSNRNTTTGINELLMDGFAASYIHTGLISGVNQSYQVIAYTIVDGIKVYSKTSVIVTNKPIPNLLGSFKAVNAGYNSIKLTFTSVEGANGIEIYRSTTSAGVYTLLTTTTSIEYLNSGLVFNATYYYKARAYTLVNSVKVYGNYTVVVAAKTALITPVIKPVSGGYDRISISWSAVAGATKYDLYQALSLSGTYTLLTSTTATSYLKTALATNALYYYKVRAYRLVGTVKYYTAYSTIMSARPIPSIPASVAMSSVGFDSVKVTWTAVAGASGYEMYTAGDPAGTFVLKTTTAALSVTVAGLSTNAPVYAKVRAYRLVGTVKVYGVFTAIVTATPIPSKPAITATNLNYNSFKIAWPAVTGANGYEVEHLEGDAYVLVQDNAALSYTMSDVICGVDHSFKVRSYRLVSEAKVYSADMMITTKAIPLTPVISAAIQYSSIQLNWQPIDGASGFEVYRSATVSGVYTLLTNTTATTYLNTGLIFNTSYYYKLRAYRLVDSTTVYGNYTVVLTYKANVAAPTVTAESASSTSIKLSWASVLGATSYEISRSTTATGIFTVLGEVTAATYTNTGLVTATPYFYRIRSARLVGTVKYYSPYSVVATARPLPGTAIGLSAVSAGHDSIKVSWAIVAGASGYEVYSSTLPDSGFFLSVTTTGTTALLSGFATNAPAYTKVRAYTLYASVKYYGNESLVISSIPVPSQPIVNITYPSATSVNLTWSAIAGATVYRIYAITSEGDVLLSDQSTTSYIQSGLIVGSYYNYKVIAIKKLSETQEALSVATSVKAQPLPAAPTNLKVTPFSASSAIISWDKPLDVGGYELSRSASATGIYSILVSEVPGYETTASDHALTYNTSYFYRIRAYLWLDGVKIFGPYSTVASLKAILPTPVLDIKNTTLNFTKIEGVEGYEIYRSTTLNGTYVLLKLTGYNYYSDYPFTLGVTYFYKVRAYGYVGAIKYYSAFSNIASFKALPGAPNTFILSARTLTSNTFEWTANGAVISGFEVSAAKIPSTTYSVIYTGALTTFTHSGLTAGDIYDYKIRSYYLVNGVKVYSADPGFKMLITVGAPVLTLHGIENAEKIIRLNWDNPEPYDEDILVYDVDPITNVHTLVCKNSACLYIYDYQMIANKTLHLVAVSQLTVNGITYTSPESNVVTIKTSNIAPLAMKSYKTISTVRLNWGYLTNSELYRADAVDGEYQLIATVSNGYFNDTNVTLGKTYYYKTRYIYTDAENGGTIASEFSPIHASGPGLNTYTLAMRTRSPFDIEMSWSYDAWAIGGEMCAVDANSNIINSCTELSRTNTHDYFRGFEPDTTYRYIYRTYMYLGDGSRFYSDSSPI
ncbi:MAG: fibronectin type III domain-containing protein, partial [Erysipelotrichaceae bacterium]